MKFCHLVLDVYGINIIYKDLFDCYNAIKDGKELPEAPTSFEKMIQYDLKKKFDDSYINQSYTIETYKSNFF